MVNPYSKIRYHTFCILLISFSFALVVWSGFYGYGMDFHNFYYKENYSYRGRVDIFGYLVSTMTVANTHIGVFLVSFMLAFSSGFLLNDHMNDKSLYGLAFFIFILLLAIHTWPIIMSTSNAMRQGLSMSFLFFSLISFSKKKFIVMLIFGFLATISHKSGVFFFLLLVASYAAFLVTKRINSKTIIYFHILVGGLGFLFSTYILGYFFSSGFDTRVIGHDYRVPFLLIFISHIVIYTIKFRAINDSYNIFMYYFSFSAPSLLVNGMNWEFERLGMMMLIPYIFSFGFLLEKKSNIFYLLSTFIMLLVLTIYTGMYAALRA